MDMPVDWLFAMLKGVLPETSVEFLNQHILHPQAPFQILKRTLMDYAQRFVEIMWPILAPLVDRLVQALHSSPDLVVLGFFLLVVVVIVQVMSWVQRMMMFWTRVAMRIVFWAGVAAVVAILWQRGLEASMRDAAIVASKVAGYMASVKEIFWEQYQMYEAQERARRRSTRGGKANGWT
ncbi:hypothetical protein QBC46DRAFT_396017 [Diplogelasinospora grovesii]|uniref:Uncharacterized protein n=1 Tax=Diplogelasinospora grovesii TaxID=303347 RepID=A0AAN6N273_9PEZI|nr:hypothetical protein QBC46DRAFT_396017 [Diplogelasinospora grovesii]